MRVLVVVVVPLLLVFTGCALDGIRQLSPEPIFELPLEQSVPPLVSPPLAEEASWGMGLQLPPDLEFQRVDFMEELPFYVDEDFHEEDYAEENTEDFGIPIFESPFALTPSSANDWVVHNHVPAFIIGGGVGGFQGFSVNVSQDSQTGVIRIEGNRPEGTPFTGRFLLVFRHHGTYDVVVEVPSIVINQHEGSFLFEISPPTTFPVFQTFSFLTNAHPSFEIYSQLIPQTTKEFFEPRGDYGATEANDEVLEFVAGWLILTEFEFIERENRWEFTAFRPPDAVEPFIFDVLFLDSSSRPLAILTINPNFHIFEEGETRRLNVSNSEDLSLVTYIDIRRH